MIRIIKADGEEKQFLAEVEKRAGQVNADVEKTVRAILADVKENGDAAVKSYTAKFDCPNAQYYRVPDEAIQDALTEANENSPEFVNAMLNAVENITAFHNRQKREGFCVTEENGVIMGQRVRGLDRVGLYVPGGTAAYPSSVLMNAIPAKIAGVKEIIMVTPPLKDGTANKDILVAAALCGVDKIYLAGGAQAVAALAYGTEEIPRVSKIVGPGNIFVATAKKLLYGTVDIDMFAGPSEILVFADETANPVYLAADLMSQAEHDKLASAIMITTSMDIAVRTQAEIERQSAYLSRKDIIDYSMTNYGAIIVSEDKDYAIELANKLARFFENYLDLRLIQGVDHLDDFLKYAYVEDLPVEIYVDEHALAVLVLNMHAGLEALFDSALDLLSEHVLVDTLFSSVSGKRVKKFSDVVLGLLYFLLSHFPLIPPLKN